MFNKLTALILLFGISLHISAQLPSNGAPTSGSIDYKGNGFEFFIQNPDSTIIGGSNNYSKGCFITLLSKDLVQLDGQFIHFNYGDETQWFKEIVWFNNTCYVFATFYNVKHKKRYLFYTTLNHKTLELSPHLIKVAELTVINEKDYFNVHLNESKTELLITGITTSRSLIDGVTVKSDVKASYWVLNGDMEIIQAQADIPLNIDKLATDFTIQNIEFHDDRTIYLFCHNYTKTYKSKAINRSATYYWDDYSHSTYCVIKLGNYQVPHIFETLTDDVFLDMKMRSVGDKIHLIGLLDDSQEPGELDETVVNVQSVIHMVLLKDELVALKDTFYEKWQSNFSHISGMEVDSSDNIVYVLERRRLKKTITYKTNSSGRTTSVTHTNYIFSELLVGKIHGNDVMDIRHTRSVVSAQPRRNEASIFFTSDGFAVGLPDIYLQYSSGDTSLSETVIQTKFKSGDNLRNKVECFFHDKISDTSFIIAAKVGVTTKLQLYDADFVGAE